MPRLTLLHTTALTLQPMSALARQHLPQIAPRASLPVWRIDEAMAEEAVQYGLRRAAALLEARGRAGEPAR